MKFLKFWRKNSSSEKPPFRRIYKGEVPYLKDDDAEQPVHSSDGRGNRKSFVRKSVTASVGEHPASVRRSPTGQSKATETSSGKKSNLRKSIAESGTSSAKTQRDSLGSSSALSWSANNEAFRHSIESAGSHGTALFEPELPEVVDEDKDEEDVVVLQRRPRSVRRHSFTPKQQSRKQSTKNEPLQPAQTEKFPTNLIISSRYNIWNFIPKNLFEQFRRIVNFYFLVVAFVQTIIDSPVHPITAVSPLAFVILVTAVKQGYEDWLRHKSDDQVNNRKVKVIRDGVLQEIRARDIEVGDLVKLVADEQVPTDMLLIGSSDEFLRCQINTANLDGETNLKLRYCPSGLPHFKMEKDLSRLHVIIECEQPNADLYEFSGSLLIPASKLKEMQWSPTESMTNLNPGGIMKDHKESSGASEHHDNFPDLMSGLVRHGMCDFLSIPLSMDNLVLRGTRLKNTDHIFGVVVYTGRDTRLARNSEKTQAKFSTVEKAVNYYLFFFIGILAILVAFSSIMHYAVEWYPGTEGEDGPWYTVDFKETGGASGIFNTVGSFTVLYNYIIPISLYVTIELQKFLGSKFFVWDQDMVDEEGREPLCNTSDLNEELGQIEYLFSDKTGTLTQNVMQFRHCSIDSVRYEYMTDHKLYLVDDHHKPNPHSKPVDILASEKVLYFLKTLALCHSVQVVPKRKSSFDTEAPAKFSLTDLRIGFHKKEKTTALQRRRESLVTPEPSQGFPIQGFSNDEPMEYQASSPDEKALLESCEQLGIRYCGEKEDVMTLDVMGHIETYKRLMVLEFDADRKCMSVIVENQKHEKWLFSKGAESSIIPKCDSGPSQKTLKHVVDYALMGLRTLAVGVRKLTQSEFDTFNNDLRAARRLIKNRQEKVREVYSSIEAHMTLIGATGVEDQLQEFVPETLQSFAAAGIRVWMLTGDKLETGVNVAVSCGLITASTKQYIVSHSRPEDIHDRLMEIYSAMDASDNTCFVIDGDSLGVAFKNCQDLLRDVSMKALRVVCCRMAPLQKAQVVQMVKNSPKQPTCCAVGDGANDCAMILAAHIGIGIMGKEGRQAARCADFALAKFGHLRKAVLVHGHWYYTRLANLANYFFYKNVVFVLPQLFFGFNSNFSTQALLDGLFLMAYNIFFASFPIMIYGLLEQSYSAETLLSNPHLYKKNKKNAIMTVRKFLPWLISAMWHAAVVYYLPYFAWNNFPEIDNVDSFGTVVFSGIVIATNMKMAVETKYLTWWYFGAQLLSYLLYFIITAIYSEIDLSFIGFGAGDYTHVYFSMMHNVCFWFLMLLVTITAIVPDITYVCMRHSWKHLAKHFNSFGKGRKWLKFRKKSAPLPKPTMLFTRRSGSLTISNTTLTSYLPHPNGNSNGNISNGNVSNA